MNAEDMEIERQKLRYNMIYYLHTHEKIKNELIDFGLIVASLLWAEIANK